MSYTANTRVFTVDPQNPDPQAIAGAAAVLRRGGLVAFPTETVYGLGANALDAEAVSRIFAAKGRPATDPLIVHIHSTTRLEEIALDTPLLAYRLAARFWAGPLTLVLKRHPNIPLNVTAGGETVGVRMPSHPVALALLRAADVPVAAPSANLFARPSPTSAAHVLEDLRGRVDVVLDGGATTVGVESTVLDLTQNPPVVLRPGGVALEALRELIPDVGHAPRFVDSDEAAAAPGMLLKHYAPRAELLLFDGSPHKTLAAMQAKARALVEAGKRVGVMTPDEDRAAFAGLPVAVVSLGSEQDLEQIGRSLFAAMRALDAQGVEVILARSVTKAGLGLAIWDRLVRAAEGRVVQTEGTLN